MDQRKILPEVEVQIGGSSFLYDLGELFIKGISEDWTLKSLKETFVGALSPLPLMYVRVWGIPRRRRESQSQLSEALSAPVGEEAQLKDVEKVIFDVKPQEILDVQLPGPPGTLKNPASMVIEGIKELIEQGKQGAEQVFQALRKWLSLDDDPQLLQGSIAYVYQIKDEHRHEEIEGFQELYDCLGDLRDLPVMPGQIRARFAIFAHADIHLYIITEVGEVWRYEKILRCRECLFCRCRLCEDWCPDFAIQIVKQEEIRS